jgi:hypothetical protein
LWHLFLPVNLVAWLPLLLAAGAGIYRRLTQLSDAARQRCGIEVLPFFMLLLPASLWLAFRATLPRFAYDTGLYHISSINWAKSFSIIPGLGNLYPPLALNSSYFLFGALIEAIFSWHQVANGLLVMVLTTQIALSGFKVIRQRTNARLYDLFYVALLWPVAAQTFKGDISSPAPDLVIWTLGAVLSAELLPTIEKSKSKAPPDNFTWFFMVLITIVGITVKLSFLVIGIMTLLVFMWFNRPLEHRRMFAILGLYMALGLIPWLGRGIVLSGYFLYPVPWLSLPVEWRMPRAVVAYEIDWIRAWARGGFAPEELGGIQDWLIPWLTSLTSRWQLFEVVLPLLMIALLTVFWLATKRRTTYPLFFLPSIVSIAYWFTIAPDSRFAGISFWALGAGSIAFILHSLPWQTRRTVLGLSTLTLVSTLFVVQAFAGKEAFVRAVLRGEGVRAASREVQPAKWADDVPQVPLRTFLTDSGLVLYVPEKGDQMWDAPLPSTPYPNKRLRLRRPGDIRSGFALSPEEIPISDQSEL